MIPVPTRDAGTDLPYGREEPPAYKVMDRLIEGMENTARVRSMVISLRYFIMDSLRFLYSSED